MSVNYLTSGIDNTQSGDAAGTAINWTVDTGAAGAGNRVLYVAFFMRGRTQTIASVTYNGVAMTALGAQIDQGPGSIYGRVYRLVAPATGANTLTMDPSAASNTYGIEMCWWVGENVDQTTPESYMTPVQGANVPASTAVGMTVTSATGRRILVFCGIRNTTAGYTATPTNYTERQDQSVDSSLAAAFGDAAGAASVATTTTWNDGATNTDYLAFGIDVRAAVTGPTPTSVAPDTGDVEGGEAVTITGTGFDAAGGASEGVTFGGVAATSVVFVGPTEITCVTPAHAAGAVDVVVTNGDGTTGTLVGGFTYVEGPVVTSPMGPSDSLGAVPTGELTSDIPLDTDDGAFLRLNWVTPRGTLRRAAFPATP